RDNGINVELDQYYTEEIIDWPRWCNEQISRDHSDFVLCVCTVEYYRRIEGKVPPEKGKGVYWEGSLIDDELYDAKGNKRFIPILFDDEPDSSIPRFLRGWTFCRLHNFALADSGFEQVIRILTGQASVIKNPLGPVPVLPPRAIAQVDAPLPSNPTPQIAPPRLRHGAEQLFGREKELKLLDDAWNNPKINVATFVAFGGVGKTSLIFEWMNLLGADGWRGAKRVFDWSFYSQGTREQGASADVFIAQALDFFGDPEMAKSSSSPWEKGARLAQLVAQERNLLVLDGLEPLQYPPGPMGGKLKDPAVEILLRTLARHNPGLCIVTTRENVTDLTPFHNTTALEWRLDYLSEDAGAALLEKLGVHGTLAERRQLSNDVNGHALTLNILGSYLVRAHSGDIRRRDQVKIEKADAYVQNGHAFKAMAAYETWLMTGGEIGLRQLSVLRLLSLFDRPADNALLELLRQKPSIAHLSKPLIGLKEEDWNATLSSLRDANLVFIQSDRATVDTHPLIREYFAIKICKKNLVSWRSAHRRIYEYLRDTTEDKPQPTLEDLQPLYQAIAHGCQAGLRNEAFNDVYTSRIRRGNKFYSLEKLGAFGTDLGTLAYFFEKPWNDVGGEFKEEHRGLILSETGYCLRALGRLSEALKPMRGAANVAVRQEQWHNAAIGTGNLSELDLTLGDISGAVDSAKQAINFATRSSVDFQLVKQRSKLAVALLHAGGSATTKALDIFGEVEILQSKLQPQCPFLYSMRGFYYCSLLLAEVERAAWQVVLSKPISSDLSWEPQQVNISRAGLIQRCQDVEQRAKQILELTLQLNKKNNNILEEAISFLTLGRVALFRIILEQLSIGNQNLEAHSSLATAVSGLRRSGQQFMLPLGLLANALLLFFEGNPNSAVTELNEALEVAERGPMRLHMADIQLHRARLFRDKASLTEARKLIEQCGYWRRKEELEDAEEAAKTW
ncbi:MAG: hypothetical protein JWQ71_1841, partial [Pedosphaera sp.]|nr:hypothetical protein [Pedosphaera sp.]